MFFFKRKNCEEERIKTIIKDMQLYLENNYKDLAIQARKDAISLVEKSYQEGKLSKEKYDKYQQILETYTKEMAHYNHQEFYHS